MDEFTERARPFLVSRIYAGSITLDEFIDKFEAAVRKDEQATLAASAELRSVEEALADVQKRAVVGVGQKDFWPKIDAALSALRAITGRKA